MGLNRKDLTSGDPSGKQGWTAPAYFVEISCS